MSSDAPMPDRDPYAPGGRLHWIGKARHRQPRRKPTADTAAPAILACMAEMMEDGDVVWTGDGFKLAERVEGGAR